MFAYNLNITFMQLCCHLVFRLAQRVDTIFESHAPVNVRTVGLGPKNYWFDDGALLFNPVVRRKERWWLKYRYDEDRGK